MNIPTEEEMNTVLCQQWQQQDEDQMTREILEGEDHINRIIIPRMSCGMTTFEDAKFVEKYLKTVINQLRIK